MQTLSVIRQRITAPKSKIGRLVQSKSEIFVISLVVFVTRWSTLMQPLVERHDFRQTQTAFTTLTMADGQGGLFSSKLPLFGAPWELPLEFPLFQYIASIAYKVFNLNIDFANRVTALSFFCLCLFPLQTIALRYMSRLGAFLACLLFAFSPFAIQWSRASLIEYCVVFFGLLFVSFSLEYWERPSWSTGVVAALCGATAGLIKVTTLLPMIIFLVILILNKRELFSELSRNLRKILGAAAILLSVLITTQMWVKFSDHIRASNPATVWLTQSRLNQWNFGTLQQRQEILNWKVLYERIDQLISPPSTILIFILIGVIARRSRRLVLASLISTLLTMAVFFNLYIVHDYYLIAISFTVALIVAGTIDAIWSTIKTKRVQVIGWVLIPILTIGYTVVDGKSYWASAYNKYPRLDSELAQLSQPHQQAFVSWGGWNSLILYYANRKGMMLTPEAISLAYLKSLPDLNKYDFYAGNTDWPDVMKIRGLYSPAGQFVTRIDNNINDLRALGVVFGNIPTPPNQIFVNAKVMQCNGTDALNLREIPMGTYIKITNSDSQHFSVSQNLQSVPVGTSIQIVNEIPKNNSGMLVCGGDDAILLEW